jgi:hypothetical protein
MGLLLLKMEICGEGLESVVQIVNWEDLCLADQVMEVLTFSCDCVAHGSGRAVP